MLKEELLMCLQIISMLAIPFVGYHKYLMKQLDRKIDKDDCEMQQEILQEKRSNLERLVEERTKTLFKQQKEIKEELGIIKEHLLKK